MDQAENRYSIRRVEFVGNQYTRDNLLRVEMPGLREGDIFTKAILRKSLNDVSRLKSIYPITIDDVDVRLNREEKTIDMTLFFRERRRVRPRF
jgi:outer membrane protein assembly factor BamA